MFAFQVLTHLHSLSLSLSLCLSLPHPPRNPQSIFTNEQLDVAIGALEITLHTSGTASQDRLSESNSAWLAGDTKSGCLSKPSYARTSQTKRAINSGRNPSALAKFVKTGPVYRQHYFVLLEDTYVLEYYEDATKKKKKGELDLRAMEGLCLSAVVDAPPNSIDLMDTKQHYTLAAESENDMLLWAIALRRCLARSASVSVQKKLGGEQESFSPDENRRTSFIEQDSEDDAAVNGDREGNFQDAPTPVPNKQQEQGSKVDSAANDGDMENNFRDVLTPMAPTSKHGGQGLIKAAQTAKTPSTVDQSCDFFTEVPTPHPLDAGTGAGKTATIATATTTPQVRFSGAAVDVNKNAGNERTPYALAETPGDEYYFKEVMTPAFGSAGAGADADAGDGVGGALAIDSATPIISDGAGAGAGTSLSSSSANASNSKYEHYLDEEYIVHGKMQPTGGDAKIVPSPSGTGTSSISTSATVTPKSIDSNSPQSEHPNFKDVHTPMILSTIGSSSARVIVGSSSAASPRSHDGTPVAFTDVLTPFATTNKAPAAAGAGAGGGNKSSSTLIKTVHANSTTTAVSDNNNSIFSKDLLRSSSPFQPISPDDMSNVAGSTDKTVSKANTTHARAHGDGGKTATGAALDLDQDMQDAAQETDTVDTADLTSNNETRPRKMSRYDDSDSAEEEDDEEEEEIPFDMCCPNPQPLTGGIYGKSPPIRSGMMMTSEVDPEINEGDDDDDMEFLHPPAKEDSDPWTDVADTVDDKQGKENSEEDDWSAVPVAHTTQMLKGSGSNKTTPIPRKKHVREADEDEEEEEEEEEELARVMPMRPSDLLLISPFPTSDMDSSSGKTLQPDITATSTLDAGYLANTTSVDIVLNYPTVSVPTRYTESSANSSGIGKDRTTFNAPVAQWDLSDERTADLPLSKQALLTCMPLARVTGITATNNLLILQGRSVSTIVTGTLKHVEIKSQLVVKDNTVLHTTRGSYATGYLRKWPSATQSIGRQTKRYFILKDSLLRYYRQEPRSLDACVRDFMYRMNISAFSTVRRHKKYLLNCIRIHRNEDPDDILWVRVSASDLENGTCGGPSSVSAQSPNTNSPTMLRYGDMTPAELTHKEENKWIREIGNAILNSTNNGFNCYSKPFIGTFPAESARASPVRVPKMNKKVLSADGNGQRDGGKVNVKGKWEWSEVNGIQRDSNGEPITTTTASPVLTKTRVERRWYQDSNLYVSCLTIDALSVPIPSKQQAQTQTMDSFVIDEQLDKMMLQCALYSYTRERHPLTNKLNSNGDFFVSVGAHWEGLNPAVSSRRSENISKCTDIHYDLVGDLGRPMYVNYGIGSYLRTVRLCYNNNNVTCARSESLEETKDGIASATSLVPVPAPVPVPVPASGSVPSAAEPALTEMFVGGTGGRLGVALLDTTPFSDELAALSSTDRSEKETEKIPFRKKKRTLRVISCLDLKVLPDLVADATPESESESATEGSPSQPSAATATATATAAIGHSKLSTVTAIAAASPPSTPSKRKGYTPVAVVSGDDMGHLVFWQRRSSYSYSAVGAEDTQGGPLIPVMTANLATAIGSEGVSLVEHHDVSDDANADYRSKRTASRENHSSEPESIISIEFLTIDTSSSNPHYASSANSHGSSASNEKRGRIAPLDVDSQFITVTTSRRAIVIAIRPPKVVSANSPQRTGFPPAIPTPPGSTSSSTSSSASPSGNGVGIAAASAAINIPNPVYILRWVELDRVPTWGTRAVFSLAPVVTIPSYANSSSSGNLAAMVGNIAGSSGSYGSPHKDSPNLRAAYTPNSKPSSPVNTPVRSEQRQQVQKTSSLTMSLSRPIYTFILWKVVEEDGRENLVPITGKVTADAKAKKSNQQTGGIASTLAAAAVGSGAGAGAGPGNANNPSSDSKAIKQSGSSKNKPVSVVAASVGSGGTTPRERSGSIRHIDRLEGLGSPVVADIVAGSLTMSHSFLSHSHSHSHYATSYTTGGHFFNANSTSGADKGEAGGGEKTLATSYGSHYSKGNITIPDTDGTGNNFTERDEENNGGGEDEDMFALDNGEDEMERRGGGGTGGGSGLASSASSNNSVSPSGSLGTSIGSGNGSGFGSSLQNRTGTGSGSGSGVRVGGIQISNQNQNSKKKMAMLKIDSPGLIKAGSFRGFTKGEEDMNDAAGSMMASSLSAYNVMYPPSPVAFYDDSVTTVDTSDSGTHTPLGTPRGNVIPFSARVGYFGGQNGMSSSPVGTGLGYTGTGIKPPGAAAAIQREKAKNLTIFTGPAASNTGAIVTHPTNKRGPAGSSGLMEPNWRRPQSVQGIAVVRASNEAAARALKQGFYGANATHEKMKPRSSVRNSNNTKDSKNNSRSGNAAGNNSGSNSAEKRELSFSFGPKGGKTIDPSGIEELSAPPSGIVRHRCFRSEITEAQLMSILTTKMKPL